MKLFKREEQSLRNQTRDNMSSLDISMLNQILTKVQIQIDGESSVGKTSANCTIPRGYMNNVVRFFERHEFVVKIWDDNMTITLFW